MEVELVLIVVGGLVLGLGVWSNYLRRSTVIPEPFVALVIGVLVGPSVLGWLQPSTWAETELLLEHAARLTLAIALMAVALRLPPHYLERHGRSLAFMVLLVMPFMWLAAGVAIHLVLGLPMWVALLIGAVVTPTDPIVLTSMMVGDFAEERLPGRIRHLLSMEAGTNDGLALPLMVLPALVLGVSAPEAVATGLLGTLAWQVGGAGVLGVALGYGAGTVLTWSEEHDLVERHSLLAFSLALTLLTLGIAELIGVEGVFAVFMAGLAFTPTVGAHERKEEEGVQEAVAQFFYLPAFALVGAVIPWEAWLELGWRAALLIVVVLVVRRLPVLLAAPAGLHTLRGTPDRLFVGWFGPMGMSTVLYAMLAWELTGRDEIWPVASLLIVASTLLHGVSANPLTRRYSHHAIDPDEDDGAIDPADDDRGRGGDRARAGSR